MALPTAMTHGTTLPKAWQSSFVRKGTSIEPLIHGAGHESGRRAGTENVLLNVALGAACRIARPWLGMASVRQLRDRFWKRLRASLGDRVVLNGHADLRLPNTLDVSFRGRIGTDMLDALDGVAASTGSACHDGRPEMSPVLRAMGLAPEVGLGAVRFSLGRTTTQAEIDAVVDLLLSALA